MLPAYEEHNSCYRDGNGAKIDDLITWFMNECGWNSFRVRLFVEPKNTDYDGVIQDIDYVKKLGKRIKDAGASFLLDFHYSDTWVDASHIQAPEAWKSMTASQKAAQIYTYTKESLETLKSAGATPDFVQVGNEIMYGFMGVAVKPYDDANSNWTDYLNILSQGCKAVREVCPNTQIIIHTDRPCNAQYNKYYYSKLKNANIDFDIIGLSYYPFWHGYLPDLKSALLNLKTEFPDKKVQIVETAYNFQYWPTSGINYDTRPTWSNTIDGQYKFIKDLISALSSYSNVNGLYYWFPEEAGNGDDTKDWSKPTVLKTWLNRGFWYEDVNANGHWPIKASEGMAPYLFKSFLNTTGIENLTIEKSANNAWYTLSGQKVSNPTQKGIYLHNGKKMIKR